MYLFKKIVFLAIMLFTVLVLSQNETNNWYFGENAGINFKDTRPIVLNNGAMSTPAGCSSISDRNGNLLFYTNGGTIWNRNHEIMENGATLAGDINNTQTSIIIPKPNDDSTYYIFLTRVEKTTSAPLFTPGLFFAEVRFSNNKPLGEVTIRSSRLLNTTTERLTAIHDIESESIKVVAFGSENADGDPKDTFFVFNIDENGINRTPIKSKVNIIKSSKGGMKFTPDGKKIALADYDGNNIYIYNFNNTDSSIAFDFSISPNVPFSTLFPYSVEFSPDSRIIYFTAENASFCILFKYLLYSVDPLYEKQGIASSSDYRFGDLQLASNGKIYVANYFPETPINSIETISVINDPENEEDSGFSLSSFNLNPNASYKGLPNFISSFLRNRIITENKCVEETFEFYTDSYMPIDSILWEFGDGSTSTELTPTHIYNVSGGYVVNATITYNNRDYLIQKKIEVYAKPLINSNETLTQCDTDYDGVSLFNLYNIEDKVINLNRDFEYFFYNSNNNALNDINPIESPENYINKSNPEELFVRIVTPEGCYTISNFFIENTNSDLLNSADIYVCENSDNIDNNGIARFDLSLKESEIRTQFNIPASSKVNFYSTFSDAQTKVNPPFLFVNTTSTTLWFRIETSNNDCAGIGSFNAIVNSAIVLDIEDSYTICYSNEDSSINLDGNQTNDAWEWKDSNGNIISTNQKISISTPGNYSLTAYKTENNLLCSRTEYFDVRLPNPMAFYEVKTENNQIFASINGFGVYEFSIDGINYFGNGKEYTFSNVKAGIYTLHVKDVNDCEQPISQQVAFIGYPRYFTPNNDGINDYWKIEGISNDLYISGDIYIYDRYGRSLYFMDLTTNLHGWDGTFNGKKLASNDYWFKATLTDNENNTFTKTGHFSAKY
ncbi:T9SS type B sorting domain-containing protein [Sabulilitoribacter multivorans]|uniref:T9SS type B sorting domain-containing protein n=1 Tax=Flaviramulus multivorans TaxID=1304750 RepID=A0ABS9IK61_9FLAO|nr:T9SS type B sorting domain-containing protein [Flaviramulus multivorans]MCF7560967.1 T9SS type B sorting domain-containing protein [Flaviramulus multivorans]